MRGAASANLTALHAFPEGEDGVPLVILLHSRMLQDLHAYLAEQFDLPGQTFEEYLPHVTVGYLRPDVDVKAKYEHDLVIEQAVTLRDLVLSRAETIPSCSSPKLVHLAPAIIAGSRADWKEALQAL